MDAICGMFHTLRHTGSYKSYSLYHDADLDHRLWEPMGCQVQYVDWPAVIVGLKELNNADLLSTISLPFVLPLIENFHSQSLCNSCDLVVSSLK
jgi:hypothetical protein